MCGKRIGRLEYGNKGNIAGGGYVALRLEALERQVPSTHVPAYGQHLVVGKLKAVPQYRVVWHDGRQWHSRQVSRRTTPFSLSGVGTKMIPMSRPKVAVCGKRVYCLFRDEERGSRVSVAMADSIGAAEWVVSDLTTFSVGSWEPSIDSEMLKLGRLHVYVQATAQGDGEKVADMKPQPVYVLEVKN